MVFNLVVSQLYRRSLRIEADTKDEAFNIVRGMLSNEELILYDCDHAGTRVETLGHFRKDSSLTNSEDIAVDTDYTSKHYKTLISSAKKEKK